MTNRHLKKQHLREYEERLALKLWCSPLKTSYYFIREILYQFIKFIRSIFRYKILACLALFTIAAITFLRSTDGPHREIFAYIEKKMLWHGWWILLGFLSSCGFGSGLHTFVLYLGPFIAQVTMSAYICNSLDFPEPPYPDEIVCPKDIGSNENISFLNIVRKVQLESILWGFGTAIGELPPYFMARGARLSGKVGSDEIEVSLSNNSSSSELETDASRSAGTLDYYQRLELFLQRLVTRAGFFGIMLCASVPNPLFDLAGMTCGHFLVPFGTFFGATCIGKALVKVHIQQFFVIAASSEDHVDALVAYIGKLPFVGSRLQRPLSHYLQQQKDKLQRKTAAPKEGWIQFAITVVVTAAMVMFVVSIVNAMAQNNHRRLCKERQFESPKNGLSRPAKTCTKRD